MTSNQAAGTASSGRARTLEGLVVMNKMVTPEGLQRGLGIQLRPTDVVIAPYGKCGTTWLQQICHTLRTRGDMDFDDISRVVPWLESSTDLGLELDAEQKANPRLFKSHLDAKRVPKGGHYIVSCRDPGDAAYSMYRFMEGWFLEPGAVSVDDFVRGTFMATGMAPGSSGEDYWAHLSSWWARREDPDVLFLAYEHMKQDLNGTIRKVAAFMGIELDDELLSITAEHASLAFMHRHKDRFDDKMMRDRSVEVCGLPADSESAKVRVGRVGESSQQLSPEVTAELAAIWRSRITPELGFENYQAMIADLLKGAWQKPLPGS
jgi:hypothetical protein